MRTLYPEIEAHHSFRLPVSGGHTLHVEQSGNPNAKPIVFIHGGPGGGTEPNQRRYFHPEKWNATLFDQRGCGKSTPFANLDNNTTWDLVADIERIRECLGYDSWHVFGGSWGSTLALAYAISHPERVRGLILRGIFLLRKQEIDWFYQHGVSEMYPDAWEDFLEPIPHDERHNLVEAYHKRLTSANTDVARKAARAWSTWEGRTSKLLPDEKFISHFGEDDFSFAFARIECHYFINKGFFTEDGWLLKNVNKIQHIPAVIVQGRYDMPCPVRSAWDLHRAWPQATLKIIPDAGHAAGEIGNTDALVEATDSFANLS